MTVVVVLVEPAGPLNIGSVARLCANFGVDALRLVNPRCEVLCDDALRMAVHAAPLLRQATIHPDLETAIGDCSRVIATCGRLDHGGIPLQTPDTAINWLLAGDPPYALVFGREDRGLTNDELRLCQRVLTLHSQAAYPSLNLSHAVAVVLHDLARHQLQARAPQAKDPSPAPAADLTGLLDDAAELLLEAGFLLPHTRAARMGKVRDLLQRATCRAEEVALFRGMVRQLRWAIRAERP